MKNIGFFHVNTGLEEERDTQPDIPSSDKVKVKMTTPQYRSYGADTQRGDRTDLTAIVTATPQVLRHSQTKLGQVRCLFCSISILPNLSQVVFKVPDSPASAAARRRKKVKVLEEEEYIDRVEAIIGIRFTSIRHIPV